MFLGRRQIADTSGTRRADRAVVANLIHDGAAAPFDVGRTFLEKVPVRHFLAGTAFHRDPAKRSRRLNLVEIQKLSVARPLRGEVLFLLAVRHSTDVAAIRGSD